MFVPYASSLEVEGVGLCMAHESGSSSAIIMGSAIIMAQLPLCVSGEIASGVSNTKPDASLHMSIHSGGCG